MSSVNELRVLIVEDDPSLLRVLSVALNRKCRTVYEAVDGQKALEVLSNHRVDLVVSDIQMPVLDGIGLLAAIRNVNPDVPVVLFVTGQAQINEEQSLLLGASGLLAKPVKLKDLLERIETLMTTGKLLSSPNP